MMYRGIVALFMFVYLPSMAFHVVKYNYNTYKTSVGQNNYRMPVCWGEEVPSDANDTNEEINTELEDFDEMDEEELKLILGKYNKLWVAYYDEFYSKKAFMRRHKKRQRSWKRLDKTLSDCKRKLNKIKKDKSICWD